MDTQSWTVFAFLIVSYHVYLLCTDRYFYAPVKLYGLDFTQTKVNVLFLNLTVLLVRMICLDDTNMENHWLMIDTFNIFSSSS